MHNSPCTSCGKVKCDCHIPNIDMRGLKSAADVVESLYKRIAELEAKLSANEPTIPIETMEKLPAKDRRIQELEAALAPFNALAMKFDDRHEDSEIVPGYYPMDIPPIRVMHLRRVRDALEKKGVG